MDIFYLGFFHKNDISLEFSNYSWCSIFDRNLVDNVFLWLSLSELISSIFWSQCSSLLCLADLVLFRYCSDFLGSITSSKRWGLGDYSLTTEATLVDLDRLWSRDELLVLSNDCFYHSGPNDGSKLLTFDYGVDSDGRILGRIVEQFESVLF